MSNPFAKLYNHEFRELKYLVMDRDGNRCQYCGSDKQLCVHHIRPLRYGGLNRMWNLITVCRTCHLLDHGWIKHHGCCTIPGPDWDEYWNELTIPADVDNYRTFLTEHGVELQR